MLDHIGLSVADHARSRAFYVDALAPLGFVPIMDLSAEQTGAYAGTGFGTPGRPRFWIGTGDKRSTALHVAFEAPNRAAVDAFYRAAIAAGGRDNGAPGLRPHYHASYYGAFVFDPDGNNVEAVAHLPE